MERMKRKGYVGFLIMIIICMVMVLPSFVYADVTINTAETSMVDLETRNVSGGRNAYVTSTGSVDIDSGNALWATVGGWTIDVGSGRLVQSTDVNGYGVLFADISAYLSGTLTNRGNIYGGLTGVGMGSGTINNYGSITGNANNGIYMTGPGSKTITNYAGGSIDGNNNNGVFILGSSAYTSSVYIINAGDITANWDGINIESNTGTVQITNSASGAITSTSSDGIDIENTGSTTVTNNGDITAVGYGIYAFTTGTLQVTNSTSGTITSTDSYGIYLENTGSTSVINSGDIGSVNDGIYINNQGTTEVINTVGGSITSSTYAGMNILSTGNTTVTNSGEINAADHGIYLDSEGTTNVTNSGRITAGYGIYLENHDSTGNTTVTNALGGTITANDGYGIYTNVYSDLVTVTNNGTITSSSDGIYVYPYSATVTNNGMITSTGGSGIYIHDGAGTSTVTNNGQIDANQYGIYVENEGPTTVTNSGTILAVNYEGIHVYQEEGPTTVTNTGTISANSDHGIYVDGWGTTNVTNSGIITGTTGGYGIYVENGGITNVSNSGQIMTYGTGIEIYTNDPDEGVTNVTNVTNSGLIQSSDYYGIYIESEGTTNVTNSGTIMSYYEGIYIDSTGTEVGITNVTNVINSGLIQSSDDYGININSEGIVNVTNSGQIMSYDEGIYIENTGDTTVTNSGTIMSENDYGLYIDNTGTANVTNSGQIISHDQGMYIDNTGTANVTNSGQIMSEDNNGIYINNSTAGIINVNNTASGLIMSNSDGIYIINAGTANVTNSGTISTDDEGIRINNSGDGIANVTNSGQIMSSDDYGIVISGGTANVTNSGLISTADSNGVNIDTTGIANVTNSGTIMSTSGSYVGIMLQGLGTKTVTNSGFISGTTGIYSPDGNTTINNSGTITGTGGTAIRVDGANNQVTLGTGSVINGNIVANYVYETPIFLEGHGTIGADQIQQFASLNKTGSGTWTLTGDMDYESSYNYNGHSITVESGVLALAARGSIGGGVVTRDFTQMHGASLGFVVTPTGDTGALTVTGATTADFNNGTIVVIPTAGHYAKTTTYENVLTADSIVNPWTNVKGTAFLKPYLVEDADWIHFDGNESYDLVLNRLSFAKGAVSSNNSSVGGALDGMYEDATGDMRDILDHLVVLSPGAAQDALTQMGGGTHTALQFMSFEGLNKYHWALNNHLGGGSGFTGGSGLAGYQNGYPQGLQTAMAAGGTSMSDAAPMLLAAVGNLGTVASGTKWDLWADGYYSKGDRSSADVISRYNSTLYGGLMGFDYRLTDKLLIGISAGISQNDVEFENLMDKGEVESYQGSVYTYYDAKPWYVEGVLTYAANTYTMDRVITIGDMTRVANSEYNGDEYAGYAEVGYKLDAGGIVMIRPMVAFQAAYLMQDGYTETGAGDLNLVVDERDTGSYQSYLGVNISKAITMGNFVLTPEARAKWAHEFSSDDHLINAKFSGAGSGSFTVAADRPSRDTAILGLGLNGRFNKNLSMYIQYDAELNSDYTNHTGMMGLRFAW